MDVKLRDDDADLGSSGRYEMNLAEWPIFLLGNGRSQDKTTVLREVVKDKVTGKISLQEICIEPNLKYGYPTERDGDVLVALISMTKWDNDFTRTSLEFTHRQILKVMGWDDSGRSYDRVGESLIRWSTTHLVYRGGWFDKSKRSGSHVRLALISAINLPEDSERSMDRTISVAWGPEFFRSLSAGYIRSLDLDTFYALKRPTSKQMYLYLGKQFGRQNSTGEVRFNLRQFGTTRLALSTSHNVAQIKRQLDPALQELESVGFLEPMGPSERYVKVRPGEWDIVLRRRIARVLDGPFAETPTALPRPAPARQLPGLVFPDPPDMGELLELMRSRRMEDEETMEELARQYTDNVRPMVDLFDVMVKVRHKVGGEVVGPGYLARMIKKPRRKMPESVQRKWEDLRAAEAARAAMHGRETTPAPAPSRSDEERVKAKFDSLSPEERRGLEAWARETYAELIAGKERETAGYLPTARKLVMDGVLRDAILNGVRQDLGLPLLPMD